MLQVRNEKEKGDKKYVPWTYWSDDQWRNCEPEGLLPLWGLEQLKNYSTVFLHEGAKAARAMAEMCARASKEAKECFAAHPWAGELSESAHLGWIGGAPNPHRTDWSVLNKAGLKSVFIVSDNDDLGVKAVPRIAKALRCPTYNIKFTNEWTGGFDLANEFPAEMFKERDGYKHYTGPSFKDCLHPATWATDVKPNPSGRGAPVHTLRDSFNGQWVYVAEIDTFVNIELPHRRFQEKIFNNVMSAFSDTPNIAGLIHKQYIGPTYAVTYRPDHPKRQIIDEGNTAINLYMPSDVRPKEGDARLWLEFLEHLIPGEEDRNHVERWCATLIAKTDIKMNYAMLLSSQKQGVGKTTRAV
jgi:hypothetical protein